MMIISLKIVLAILLSYAVSYAVTMICFWIDLNINRPDREQMAVIKHRHLFMHKFIWLAAFAALALYLIL